MNFKILLFPVVFFGFINIAFGQTPSLSSGFQSWNELQLIRPVVKGTHSRNKSFDKIILTFTGGLRIGRKKLDFLDNRIAANLDYRVNKFVSLVNGVIYRKDETTINRQRYERRLSAGVVLSKSLKGFTIRNRNMIEHCFRNSRIDTNIYRNRIQVSYSLKYKNKELFTPYISEEDCLDLGSSIWVQNEFYAGLKRRISPRATIDVAYNRHDSSPVNVNGLSFDLMVRLR